MNKRADAIMEHPLFNWVITVFAFVGASGPIALIAECFIWLRSAEWRGWDVGTVLVAVGYEPEGLKLLGVRKIIEALSGIPIWIATPVFSILALTAIFCVLDEMDKKPAD